MRKFYVVLLALALMLGVGSQAKAATSAINNLPGGAGILQWMAAPDGTHTLINIQNVRSCGAVTVHITFYDYNSNHLFDIDWPMSSMDNVGIAVTGDGTTVNLDFEPGETPTMPAEQGLVHNHLFTLAGVGAGQLQYGYATVAVDQLDSANPQNCYYTQPAGAFLMAAGNGNGNPMDDPTAMNSWRVLPDLFIARAAILFPTGVLGMNGQMLQGFMNMPRLSEDQNTNPTFVGVLNGNAVCAANVDWDGDNRATEITNISENGGVTIQAHELYITDNFELLVNAAAGGQIAINTTAANCNRSGRAVALGSATTSYLARYNVTPGLTDTNLVMVFPANDVKPENPANLIADNRGFNIFPYNDNEQFVSTNDLRGPEVTIAPFYSTSNAALPGQPVISHTTYTHGEAVVTVRAPLYGYTYTTVSGIGADIYPIVPRRIYINAANLLGIDPQPTQAVPNVSDIVMVP